MNEAQGQPTSESGVPNAAQAPQLHKYFQAMIKADASDLHLKADAPPHIRTRGGIRATNNPPLSAEQIQQMAMELLTDAQTSLLAEHGSVDVAHALPDSDRFRINIFRQRGDLSVAVRRVTRDIPDFESLRLPGTLGEICEHHQGLVLLAGITGSGKSTTIASMLEYINRKRACHIVTIEDPIEYLYTDKKALVNQREVGIDVESFEFALKSLMREDPDVILIGEMRDRDTFQAALQAAETGHLVFGTVHASSCSQTVGRILDLFDPESRPLARQSLAFNLRAVVCQKLLPSIDERFARVPAIEVMLANPSVRQLIAEARDGDLPDVIRGCETEGMQDFTKSLLDLIESETIEPATAYAVAPNADELKMRMKGIQGSQRGLVGR